MLRAESKLYDRDYCLWIETTVDRLKDRNFEEVDWENLIEEIESLSKRDKRKLKRLLLRLFEHLLKRKYVGMQECYRGWDIEIRNFSSQIKELLEDSPSLRNYLKENANAVYKKAVESVSFEYEIYDFSGGLDVDKIVEGLK